MPITAFFLFPRHGHNACDCHLGAVSHHLSFVIKHLERNKEVLDRASMARHIGECSYTTVENLPPIVDFGKRVATLEGIKSYLVFTFPEEEWSVDCQKLVGGQVQRLYFTPYKPKSTENIKLKLN